MALTTPNTQLAEAAGLARVVTAASDRLVWRWLGTSRFHDTRELTRRALTVQAVPDPGTLVAAGRAAQAVGDLGQALDYYNQALPIQRQVGDRAGEAATLTNIGAVHRARGELDVALDYYNQALPIRRQVGDRAGEAVTRYNIAMIQRDLGNLAEAVAQLEQTVELDRQIQHPDLAADTQMLHQIRQELSFSEADERLQN